MARTVKPPALHRQDSRNTKRDRAGTPLGSPALIVTVWPGRGLPEEESGRSAINAKTEEKLVEVVAVLVVGRVQVLGLGDELERIVALQTVPDQDFLE